MKLILDTNAYSALLQGHAEVASRIRSAQAIGVSTIVLGELLAGFRHGSKESANRLALEQFLASRYVEVLLVTRVTAEHFASIWSELRSKGRPIPTNDMWIAAHGREHSAEILSFDRHFQDVAGLLWSDPSDSLR